MQGTGQMPADYFALNNLLQKQISIDGNRIVRWRAGIKLLAAAVGILILLLLLSYGTVAAVKSGNSFPIFIDTESGLSLSASADFSDPTVKLNVPSAEGLENISVSELPTDIDGGSDGSHNGKDYLAYTFYLKNVSDKEAEFTENLVLKSATRNVDGAIRFRIYRDGIQTTYAKIGANGEAEYGTVPFLDGDTAVCEKITLSSGQTVRYTLVIWLEGDDPECKNELSGGSLRFTMNFSTSGMQT